MFRSHRPWNISIRERVPSKNRPTIHSILKKNELSHLVVPEEYMEEGELNKSMKSYSPSVK